jgi:hypothetical protein
VATRIIRTQQHKGGNGASLRDVRSVGKVHRPSAEVVSDPAPSKSLQEAVRESQKRDKRRSWWQRIVDEW